MTRWRVFFTRLGEWLRRVRVEADLDAELQAHLDHLTDEYVRRGLDAPSARLAARRDFGGIDRAREAVRDRRGFRPVDTLLRDVRYAIRLLLASPGFAGAAILTLALGIGVNAAIFSLVDAVLLRPLPYRDPGALVAVWELLPPPASRAGAPERIVVAPANLVDYRRARHASAVAGYVPVVRSFSGAGTPERLDGEEVTAEYFPLLGVPPLHGRALRAGDDAGVIVVSYAFWQERLGARPEAIGATLRLDDRTFAIVGVMPPAFQGISQLDGSAPIAFWTPAAFSPDVLANRSDHQVAVVARLAPGASPEMLADELRGIAGGFTAGPAGRTSVGVAALGDDIAREVRPLLVLLLAAVGLVLLLACVNVASLLVLRSIGRRRDIAVRLALGATRTRVAGELLTQSIVLAVAGAGAGLAVAVLVKGWLLALTPATIPRLDAVAIDGRVLAFTIGITALTVLIFGLLPALQLGRTRPSDALSPTERVVSGTWASRARTGLLIVEVSLSAVLLIGAALMIRSLLALNAVPLGFDTSDVLTANVRLPESRYPQPAARLQFFEEVQRRLAQVPGATGVAFGNRLPLRGGWTSGMIIEPIDGPPPASSPDSAGFQAVSPEYFHVFQIALVRGRLLSEADRDGRPPVAVVNEEFVRRFMPGRAPIGRRLRRFIKAPSVEIVGVVADIRRGGRMTSIQPEVYLPAAQTSLYPLRLEQIAVRFSGDARARTDDVRAAVWAVDRDLPVAAVRTLEEVLTLQQGERHFQTFLFGIFAVLALVLAVVGIYGVVAYAVTQRRPEIALRMALGASISRIRWSLLRHWMTVVAAGAAAGVGAALLLGRAVRSLLFEISPADPIAFALAAAVLVVASGAACLVAAHRATNVDAAAVLK